MREQLKQLRTEIEDYVNATNAILLHEYGGQPIPKSMKRRHMERGKVLLVKVNNVAWGSHYAETLETS